jgi:Mlc titration factor MtfA (ptsG expression regulator)
MVFSWFKGRRRKKLGEQPFPAAWTVHLERNFAHWGRLTPAERSRLEDIVQVLVEEKHWEGCGGLEITDEIRVTIAAQAGVLLLGMDHDYYDNVDSILVYPSGYSLPRTASGPGGVVGDDALAVLGSAHYGGPVVLSWDAARSGGRDARDGRNLVYHEFAHKLDMLDGVVDGTPDLDGADEVRAWARAMTAAYDDLRARANRGKKTLLDKYGATNVAELFAVATEVFFEKPAQLKKQYPGVYDVMLGFYGQDLAARGGS